MTDRIVGRDRNGRAVRERMTGCFCHADGTLKPGDHYPGCDGFHRQLQIDAGEDRETKDRWIILSYDGEAWYQMPAWCAVADLSDQALVLWKMNALPIEAVPMMREKAAFHMDRMLTRDGWPPETRGGYIYSRPTSAMRGGEESVVIVCTCVVNAGVTWLPEEAKT